MCKLANYSKLRFNFFFYENAETTFLTSDVSGEVPQRHFCEQLYLLLTLTVPTLCTTLTLKWRILTLFLHLNLIMTMRIQIPFRHPNHVSSGWTVWPHVYEWTVIVTFRRQHKVRVGIFILQVYKGWYTTNVDVNVGLKAQSHTEPIYWRLYVSTTHFIYWTNSRKPAFL